MNSLKRWLVLLLIVLVAIGACGCRFKEKRSLAEQMRTQALEYLNSRYTDKFTAMGYSGKNWAYKYESITFSSEKFPEEVVEVRAYHDDDGSVTFKDNYYQCYMMEDAVKYCKSIADLEEIHVKVRFPNTVWSDELKDAKTFEDWVLLGNCKLDVFVISFSVLMPEMQIAYVEKLASEKIAGSVSFMTTDDENLLEDETLDEILNHQREYVIDKNDYYISPGFEIERN